MPPKRGKGGNKAYAGRGRGKQGTRNNDVIDLTSGGATSQWFGMSPMNPFGSTLAGSMMPIAPLSMGSMQLGHLLGPHTALCYGPGLMQGGASDGANLQTMQAMQAMQQQLWLSQCMGQMPGYNNTVQVKMSEADLQQFQMQKFQQQLAMFKALSAQTVTSLEKPKEVLSTKGSDTQEDDDEEDPSPSGSELDVAKHQLKEEEINRLMNETIGDFMVDKKYTNDPAAALKACREKAKEITSLSTPVKQLEEVAERVALRVAAQIQKSGAQALKSNHESHRDCESEMDSRNSKKTDSKLLLRLAAVEQELKEVAGTPTTVTTNFPLQGMQMPGSMGWTSPLQALWMQQQQQVAQAACAAQAGFPMVGSSPTVGDYPLVTLSNSTTKSDDHYGIVVNGDQHKGKGYGWMTTRVGTLPKLLASVAEANTPAKTGGEKAVKQSELNPDSCFEPQSLKAWYKALGKGPQPSPEDTDDQYMPKRTRARHFAVFVFWRLCVMINSVSLTKNAKALDYSAVPKHAEKAMQSLMDRLYETLKQWEVDGVAGPGLHSSLCYLLVTRGMYKTHKTCPNMATKLIHRILCVLYKNGVPMSDKAFGLMDPGGGDKSNKRRKTRPKDLKTETSGESQ